MERCDLAIDIRERHAVAVDYIKLPYPDAGKGFADVASHTAHTEDGDMGFFKFITRTAAEKRSGPYIFFPDNVHFIKSFSVAVSSIGMERIGIAVLPPLSPERLP